MENLTMCNQRQRVIQLVLTIGLVLSFLTALQWGLRGMTPARADPGDLHVDGASGQDIPTCGTNIAPCQTISYTLNSLASDGDTILVAAGTYTENLVMAGTAVTLRGGHTVSGTLWLAHTGETVVDGSDADRVFYVHSGSNVVIEDVTIRRGRAPEDQCWGGGVSVSSAALTIRDSRIIDNQANCTSGQSGGGAGGGVDANNDPGPPVSLTIEDTIIANNYAKEHGAALNAFRATVSLTNVLVISNSHSVLNFYEGSAAIVNSTIAGNSESSYSVGDSDSAADISLLNTIVWNSGTMDCGLSGGTCTATYSDVEGGWPGTGNIDATPQFIDTAGGDYHLQPWSPAIDTGAVSGVPDHDLDGNPRPHAHNALVDMGAYEYQGLPIVNEGPRYVAKSGSDGPSNPCLDRGSPCLSVGHALEMAVDGDGILVAQGIYTENLSVSKQLTIAGGYEAVSWTRNMDVYTTTIDGSGSQTVLGDWDGQRVYQPAVVYDGLQYEMWFAGRDENLDSLIGYATSTDGIVWDKHPMPVLQPGPGDHFPTWRYEQPFVLKESASSYKMWFAGRGGDQWGDFVIGYATSSNGITWTRPLTTPVLTWGEELWNNAYATGPTVLYEDGIYKMWLGTARGGIWTPYIAYATSVDGIEWNWDTWLLTNDSGNSWEQDWIFAPSVLPDGSGGYQMWYGALGDASSHIGLATATDEVSWTRYNGGVAPVLSDEVYNPAVIYGSGTYTMYYSEDTHIGMATSTDGITWTKSISNPILMTGATTQWGDPVVRLDSGSGGAVLEGLVLTGGSGETAGGVQNDSGGDVTIRACTIRDNTADGRPDSWGGGALISHEGVITIIDSRIVNNHGVQGASAIRMGSAGTLVMQNTLVADNHGEMALHLNGPGTLVNVTVVNNDGGVLVNGTLTDTLIITNSIAYGNGWSLNAINGSSAQVAYSDIEGGWSGSGNIDADPMFVDAPNGDYHLSSASPCLDTGTAGNAPDHDFEGDPRPIFNGYDMGVDEVSSITAVIPTTGGTLTAPDATLVQLPAGAVSETLILKYSPQPPTSTGDLAAVGVFYELTAVYASTGQPATLQSGMHYTITVSYDEADLPAGTDEANLALYYHDGSQWMKEPTSVADTAANTITATPDHFSLWGVLAQGEYEIFLPLVIRRG